MKIQLTSLAVLFAMLPIFAGESGLMRTFQPLDGSGSGGIEIEQVTCYVSNFDSGQFNPIRYISIENIPPTTSGKGSGDLNLASTSDISFDCQNFGEDAPNFQ